jgi:hypothetical protein
LMFHTAFIRLPNQKYLTTVPPRHKMPSFP